jgi:heme/copper-type cytochrome/quinol oxidase subunit 1
VFNSGAIGTIVTVIGLALTLVALAASYRVSKRSVSTQVYRDTAAAWEAKSKAQDAENAELRAQLTSRDEKIAVLTGRVGVLQDTVTGAQAWATLERRTAEMLNLAAENRADTRRLNEALTAVAGRLGDLTVNCGQVLTAVQALIGQEGGQS